MCSTIWLLRFGVRWASVLVHRGAEYIRELAKGEDGDQALRWRFVVPTTFNCVAFTFTRSTGASASAMTPSISTPDMRMRTGSPTRAVGQASRAARSFGCFSQSHALRPKGPMRRHSFDQIDRPGAEVASVKTKSFGVVINQSLHRHVSLPTTLALWACAFCCSGALHRPRADLRV
jgi:hypothetical protein